RLGPPDRPGPRRCGAPCAPDLRRLRGLSPAQPAAAPGADAAGGIRGLRRTSDRHARARLRHERGARLGQCVHGDRRESGAVSVSIDLVNALKRSLRAQGLTYRELALRIGLSEAAVKRMFSRRAMSLLRLEQICQVLDIGLAELGAEAGRGVEPMARLSQAQEQALVDDPALMLAMFLSINRWRQDDVMAHFAFGLPQWTGLLARLDRLG